MAIVYLLLGSNLGNKIEYVSNACNIISKKIGVIKKKSSLYETEPWRFKHGENFINQVIEIETTLYPEELLIQNKDIEEKSGRIRTGKTNMPRTLDIDILFYDNLVCNSNNLIIPHPKLHLRLFTLIPLLEINPEIYHPALKKTVLQLFNDCQDKSNVVKLSSK